MSSTVGSTVGGGEEGGGLSKWLEAVSQGLFGLLFIASKDIHAHPVEVVFEMTIDLLQVKLFCSGFV